jgi:anti-sigma B factor antagonist
MMNTVNMSYIPMILKYASPETVPVSFKLGRKKIFGIPAEFSPKVSREFVDSNIMKITVEGRNRSGLTIRADYTEYRDFPVTEWRVTLTNNGKKDTPVISDLRVGGEIACGKTVLKYGNGDTCKRDGYSFFEKEIDEVVVGLKELTLDMAGLEYVSSAGLRVILKAQKIMNMKGSMKLTNVKDSIMEVFDITGFLDILTIE